jgi:hypothetical protein
MVYSWKHTDRQSLRKEAEERMYKIHVSNLLLARTGCWHTQVCNYVHRGLWLFKSMTLNPASVMMT